MKFFIVVVWLTCVSAAMAADKKMFVRFQSGDTIAYGQVEGEKVRQLSGDLFGSRKLTDRTFSLSDIKLLVPTNPTKVLALAGNYKSHLGDTRPPSPNPEVFFKPPSCLIANGEKIVLPSGSTNVHFEAELVLVIGKRAKNVEPDRALDYVFGVTCGNDVSARDWQKGDVQWWRAKGTDTFGPVGPFIVSGINYDDIVVQLRLNGEVKQKQSTRDLIHNVRHIVSFASRHVTLEPGDLIYTGTPGETSPLKAGDVVEVELEGVGVLKNPVTARSGS